MNYEDWDSKELSIQIKALGYGQYSNCFLENEICGIHLPYIKEEHLIEMGITSIGHRILLKRRLLEIVNGRKQQDYTNENSLTPQDPIEHKSYNQKHELTRRNSLRSSPRTSYPVSTTTSQNSTVKTNTNTISSATDRRYGFLTSSSRSSSVNSKNSSSISKTTNNIEKSSLKNNSSTNSKSNNNANLIKVKLRSPSLTKTTQKHEPLNTKTKLQSFSSLRFSSKFSNNSEKSNELIKCQFCGREYLPDAARRHIPVCERINGKKK